MFEPVDRTPMGLVDALCARINDSLVSYWQEAEQFESGVSEQFHAPHVHAQQLPVSLTASQERDKSKDYPVVLVMCESGKIESFSKVDMNASIKISVYFGGYYNKPDNQGWRIPAAMLWQVLRDLLSDTILGGYQLTVPVVWGELNGREPPYYTAKLETIWKGSPPAIEVPYEGIGG